MRNIAKILQINVRVATSLGNPYILQLASIYERMLQVLTHADPTPRPLIALPPSLPPSLPSTKTLETLSAERGCRMCQRIITLEPEPSKIHPETLNDDTPRAQSANLET